LTIIGAHITAERVLAWADCETFAGTRTCAPVAKLVTNPTARLVAAGCGWGAIADAGGVEAMRAVSIDDLPGTLPRILRQAAERTAGRRADTRDFLGCMFFAAGWSPSLGRCIGYTFEAETFFAPRFASTFSAPHAPELASMHPDGLADVEGLVCQQFTELRRDQPAAAGSLVAGACVTAKGVTAGPLVDLAADLRHGGAVPAAGGGCLSAAA
jgi:hypothetical protein